MSLTNGTNPGKKRQKGALRRFLQTVVLTSLLVTGGMGLLRLVGFFEKWEIAAYDSFLDWRPAEAPDDRLLVVGIDEQDIQGREEYPIQEGTVVDLIDALGQYEPRAIALDFALDFPQGTEAERAELEALLASNDRIVSACIMSNERSPGVPPGPGVSVEATAFADFPQDKDGVVRRTILVSTPGEVMADEVVRSHICNEPGAELLSLNFLLALIYLEDEEIFAEQTEAGDIVWENTVIPGLFERSGGYASTGATDYQVMLNYRARRDAVPQVSLTDVLEGTVDPNLISDRVILVGYTSPVVNDIFTTPYTETTPGFRGMSGVMVHAQATSQLISAVMDGRPLISNWPELGEIFLIGVWSLLAGAMAFYLRRWLLLTLGTVSVSILLWVMAYGLFLQGFWLPVVPMTIAGIVATLAVSIVSQARQSVYAQAIFEQLKAEMTGPLANQSTSQRDRLDALVHRAQSIRQRRGIGDAVARGDLIQPDKDPMHMEFDAPEVQVFYEQIKTQLQHKFDEEKALLETRARSQPSGSTKTAKLKALLRKSQHTRRTDTSSSKGGSHG
ncbi:MAG: CHASE2 domain-containing protein [Cyanobacteria bacterium P01_H01_bin.58]